MIPEESAGAAPQLYRLDSEASTLLLLSVDNALPGVAYYGERLSDALDAGTLAMLSADAIPMAKLDSRVPLSVLPENSRAHFGEPGLQGHRAGMQFAHRFELISATTASSAFANYSEPVLGTNSFLKLTAEDGAAGLELVLEISCDPVSNAFTWQHTLCNTGDSDYTLDWLACPTLPLSLSMEQLITLHGRWGKEFQQQTSNLQAGRYQIDNRRGRTSHEHFPGLFLGEAHSNELSGPAFGAHLGWSGNYRLIVDSLSEHQRYFQCGELLLPGEMILEPGEQYQTPVLYTAQADGFSRLSQCFHSHLRRNILPVWTRTPRPVHANSWEALYFNHDLDELKALVDAAHDTGAERFVLDDGWFMGRRDDHAGLGDWQVDPEVHPDGLGSLAAHVKSRGMQFGLWFEPEMVNPDSDLFRTHPEWVLQHAPYPLIPARYQEVLDLSQPELFDYLFNAISSLVDEYGIDYIKWDMNRDTLNPGSEQRASQHQQINSVYRLMRKLTETHPALEIESCASGGARIDFGVLRYTGRFWTSDNIDPVERLHIQRGCSLFFPPEIMGAHIGAEKAHLTGRQTSLDTRAIVALQGQTGYEFDSRQLPVADKQVIQYYTGVYQQHREWLAECRVWRLPALQGCLHTLGQVSADQQQSLWTVVSDGSHLHQTPGRLKLTGLESQQQYTLRCLNQNMDELAKFAKALPEWMMQGSLTLSGELLMKLGVHLPYLPPQMALLFACQSINQDNSF